MRESIWSTNVKATCVEKLGKCRHERGGEPRLRDPHIVRRGDVPRDTGPRPHLGHPLRRGAPLAGGDNPEVYRIHCISKKGTVWEFQRIEDPEG